MTEQTHSNQQDNSKLISDEISGYQSGASGGINFQQFLSSPPDPKSLTPETTMSLQRTIGNQATLGLLQRQLAPIKMQPLFSGLKMAIQRKAPESVEEAKAISKSASDKFPTSKPKQSKDVFSSLRIDATEGFGELKQAADQIAGDTGGNAEHRNKLKGFDRSWDKIVKKYGSDASGLIDTIGSKIVYDDFKGLYAALDLLVKRSPLRVVYFQDRFLTPVASGYSDIIMSVQLSNGHIAELRLHLKSVDAIFEKEHRLYEKIRKDGKDSLSDDELKEYEQLQSDYNKARKDAFDSLGT